MQDRGLPLSRDLIQMRTPGGYVACGIPLILGRVRQGFGNPRGRDRRGMAAVGRISPIDVMPHRG
jgi:hypothetical protein